MNKNKHIVNGAQIAELIPLAKSHADKNTLIKQWAVEMRKAIRFQQGVAS